MGGTGTASKSNISLTTLTNTSAFWKRKNCRFFIVIGDIMSEEESMQPITTKG